MVEFMILTLGWGLYFAAVEWSLLLGYVVFSETVSNRLNRYETAAFWLLCAGVAIVCVLFGNLTGSMFHNRYLVNLFPFAVLFCVVASSPVIIWRFHRSHGFL